MNIFNHKEFLTYRGFFSSKNLGPTKHFFEKKQKLVENFKNRNFCQLILFKLLKNFVAEIFALSKVFAYWSFFNIEKFDGMIIFAHQFFWTTEDWPTWRFFHKKLFIHWNFFCVIIFWIFKILTYLKNFNHEDFFHQNEFFINF